MTHLSGHERAMQALDKIGVPRENGVGPISLPERIRLAGRIVPPLLGATEVAEMLGTTTSNLPSHPNLPEPVAHLRSGRIWLREDVEAYRDAREAKRR